ncbi:MAG: hypothetical protein ACOC5T_07075 [Elusimicrobiota bacterium]
MKKSEMIERGFTADKHGKIIDDYGNEYRNESGEIEYLEKILKEEGKCPNCGNEKLTYERFEMDSGGGYYPYTCEECGFEGKECYDLEFAYHMDQNGEIL